MKNKSSFFLVIGILFLFFISKNVLATDDQMVIANGGDEESLFLANFADNETAINTQINPVTPPVTPPGPPIVSSGGGGGAVTKRGFSLSTEEIKVKLKQGTFVTQDVLITNLEDSDLTFFLNVSDKISPFVILSENNFVIKAKESKVITLDILAGQNTTPDLYIGQVSVKGDGIEKDILTAVEIESANPLFDVTVKIPNQFAYVLPGDELVGEIQLYNLGVAGKEVDVNLEYRILDSQGNEILRQTEEVAVNTQASFVKSFKIPTGAAYGRYALYVRATYNQQVASASAFFNIGKAPSIPFTDALIALLILTIIIMIIIFVRRRKIKKQVKPRKRVDEKALRRANIIRKK